MRRSLLTLAVCFALSTIAIAQPTTAPTPTVEHREWLVDQLKRTGVVVTPPLDADRAAKLPVVFVFHGHGGGAEQVRRRCEFDSSLSNVITVYLQGLPTVTRNDPAGGRAGWQSFPGDGNDRDLKFFDVVLADLQKNDRVDLGHVYAYGHSNGGVFVFALWAARGDVFRAFAVSGSGPMRRYPDLQPKPLMHIAGRDDPLAPFAFQQRSMELTRKLNGCDATSTPWADRGERYASKTGTPFISVIYDGAHAPPAWSYPMIAKFFHETE